LCLVDVAKTFSAVLSRFR